MRWRPQGKRVKKPVAEFGRRLKKISLGNLICIPMGYEMNLLFAKPFIDEGDKFNEHN
jgi:hypothetical protein